MKEAKTIQCHPKKENGTIRFYEIFGWEVQSNQRCQEVEYEGGEKYNVTFNKITFTREKNSPWYKRMCELEEEAHACKGQNVESYISAKDEYGYDERTKLGEIPVVKSLPKLAEPKKFLVPFIFFIIGVILCAIVSKPLLNDNNGGGSLLFIIGIGVVVLLFVSLSKLKFMKGLKGSNKKNAIEEYCRTVNEREVYDKKAEEFLSMRLDEIFEEAESLLEE